MREAAAEETAAGTGVRDRRRFLRAAAPTAASGAVFAGGGVTEYRLLAGPRDPAGAIGDLVAQTVPEGRWAVPVRGRRHHADLRDQHRPPRDRAGRGGGHPAPGRVGGGLPVLERGLQPVGGRPRPRLRRAAGHPPGRPPGHRGVFRPLPRCRLRGRRPAGPCPGTEHGPRPSLSPSSWSVSVTRGCRRSPWRAPRIPSPVASRVRRPKGLRRPPPSDPVRRFGQPLNRSPARPSDPSWTLPRSARLWQTSRPATASGSWWDTFCGDPTKLRLRREQFGTLVYAEVIHQAR